MSRHARCRILVVALLATMAAGGHGATAPAADAGREPIVGFSDIHVHQFANLGFGGLLVWGAPFDPDGDIAKALPWSDWTPAAPGDVVGPNGDSVGLVGCPNPFLFINTCAKYSPATGATCPPGTGNDVFHQCAGVFIHGPGGVGDLLHPVTGHLVGGYPQFDGWPRWNILSGQQVYVDWLKRAHDGGLKLMTMLAVNNQALCSIVNRLRDYGCDDMSAVDRQIQAAKDLETYVDAQSGGPGQGWYRIVRSGAEARQAITQGKLAVVLGIEVDNLFGCTTHASFCTPDYVDTQLDRYYDLGVRHVFPIHLTDNAFGGMALYNDLFAFENKLVTGDWWDVENCAPDSGINFHLDEVDRIREPGFFDFKSQIFRLLVGAVTGLPPAPPAGSNCNARGLTDVGAHLIRRMMQKHMIIDVDHTSAKAADRLLGIAEQEHYPGIASGHTGIIETGTAGHLDGDEYKRHEGNKTDAQLERIRALGGVISVILHQGKRSEIREYHRPDGSTPLPFFCGNSSEAWAQVYLYTAEKMRGGAVGIGSDFNGLAGEPAPRFGEDGSPLSGEACNGDRPDAYAGPPRPRVSYPFTAFGTGNVFDRQQIGENTLDIGTDGLGNVGLYPDFVEELRRTGMTNADLAPLFDSAEAYVRMWERSEDTTPPTINCAPPDGAWHATNVTLACSAEDPISGLHPGTDASFTLSTNIAAGDETADAATDTRQVCDTRGNCATAGPIGGNRVDRKVPTIAITQPQDTDYTHSDTLTLAYAATDSGAGIAVTTPTLDGQTTIAGHGLASGQAINLLTELALGSHIFTLDATDAVGNAAHRDVNFRVIVTPNSLLDAVERFYAAGAIHNRDSLLAKLAQAAARRATGECDKAAQHYGTFIQLVQAQRGSGIGTTEANILITDAEYLMAHCP